MAERQSARMSKITNDDLTRSGIECFIAVPNDTSGRQRFNAPVCRGHWLATGQTQLQARQERSVGIDLKELGGRGVSC